MVDVIRLRSLADGNVIEEGSASPSADNLNSRIRQQGILAELGVAALKGSPFLELLQRAARLTAEGLDTEFCKVMEYLPHERRFLVRAGVGWGPDVVGLATVGADLASPAGYALQTGKAVISNHLDNEERFRTPELLVEYGVHRAMNVILQGDGSPYGVLEVDSRSEGEFTENDISFLQGAANILGMAIERQRIESRLTSAVERQQLLLKEVNHRVKNSLQLVTTLLHVQSRSASNEEVRVRLEEAAGRITAIAHAHSQLYRSDKFESVALTSYLTELCQDVGTAREGCKTLVTGPDDIEVAIDKAIPVALVVNELITNALKYAYPDSAGTVHVDIGKDSQQRILVSVRDNGVGLPSDFEPTASRGLGMRLVRAFVSQLNGQLEVHARNPGTEFTLFVPAP